MEEATYDGSPHLSNAVTCYEEIAHAVRRSALGPREAFIAAHARLEALAGIAQHPSLVIAAVDPRARVIEAFLIPDRTALVIGRHTQCALRLPGNDVSLRHLAVLARFEQGRPVAHLWDLNTGQPFITEDDQPNSAVITDGPVYAAVGAYAIWIVPTRLASGWPPRAADAWKALPTRQFVDRRSPPSGRPAPARPVIAPPGRAPALNAINAINAINDPPSWVTSVGPPLLLGDGDEPEVGWGTLELAFEGRKQKRRISAERLGQGILVGRYERCGLSLGESTRMSRVHLLLVRIGTELWAIDTASTNGVHRSGSAISAAVLHDAEELTLASDVTLDWQRDNHAEA